MLVDDVEKLIEEEKIVACGIESLKTVSIEKTIALMNYGLFFTNIKADKNLKDKLTFLYKIDDEHYIEYYTKKTVIIIDNSHAKPKTEENFKTIIKEYKTKYKDCPIIVFKSSLEKIDVKIKNAFAKNNDPSSSLGKLFEEEKEKLRKQYEEAIIDNKKETYANKIFKELKGKKAFIVRISDLQNVRIKENEEDNNFKYYFARENRTIFTSLETTNYTILTEISAPLYEDYYTKRKMYFIFPMNVQEKTENNPLKNVVGYPRDFNDYCIDYDFFLSSPLVGARNVEEFNDNTKHLIGDNFDKAEEIKGIITRIEQEARTKLEEDKNKVERKNERDAYVDNALVDIALRLRNENTENCN